MGYGGGPSNANDFVVVGGGTLRLPKWFRAVYARGDVVGTFVCPLEISVEAVWEAEEFAYTIGDLRLSSRGTVTTLRTEEGKHVTITGTLMRSLPLHEILSDAIWASIGSQKVERSVAGLIQLFGRRELAQDLRARGPVPVTLMMAANVYTLASVCLLPPTQAVSEYFEIPHRTASHWAKLARERGHLIERTRELAPDEIITFERERPTMQVNIEAHRGLRAAQVKGA